MWIALLSAALAAPPALVQWTQSDAPVAARATVSGGCTLNTRSRSVVDNHEIGGPMFVALFLSVMARAGAPTPELVKTIFFGETGRVAFLDGSKHELPCQALLVEGSWPIWLPADSAHPMAYLGVVAVARGGRPVNISTLVKEAIPVELVSSDGPGSVWSQGVNLGALPLTLQIAPGGMELELRDGDGHSSVHSLYTVSPPKPPSSATVVTLSAGS